MWSSFQVLKHGLDLAVWGGLDLRLVLLMVLFPWLVGISVLGRQLIGFKSFTGTLMPVIIGIILAFDGLAGGILLAVVLVLTTFSRYLIRGWRLRFIVKVAVNIWMTILELLLLIGLMANLGMNFVSGVSLLGWFLVMVVAETFLTTQLTRSLKDATTLILETMVLALGVTFLLANGWIRNIVLEQPELTMLSSLVFLWLVSRYEGLRLLEVKRFKSILD